MALIYSDSELGNKWKTLQQQRNIGGRTDQFRNIIDQDHGYDQQNKPHYKAGDFLQTRRTEFLFVAGYTVRWCVSRINCPS